MKVWVTRFLNIKIKIIGGGVKKGTKIIVKVEDLNKGSKAEIRIRCDYCGKEFREKYQDYLKQKKKESLVNKDCCTDCRNHKVKEVVYEKYGVDSIFQTEEMRKLLSEKKRLDCDFIRIQLLEKNLVLIFENEDLKIVILDLVIFVPTTQITKSCNLLKKR